MERYSERIETPVTKGFLVCQRRHENTAII